VTTGNHRAVVQRPRYVDRWLVVLVLYVVLYFLLRSAIARAADGDNLIDAVQSSGPVMGSVLILAFVIKAWVTDLKGTVSNLQTKIETLSGADNGLATKIIGIESAANAQIVTLQAELRDAQRRLERLERRASGAHPRSE
jgi:outer membrane murein-binding lipoprotein Lpp